MASNPAKAIYQLLTHRKLIVMSNNTSNGTPDNTTPHEDPTF